LKREVLETYNLERQPNAAKLIKYDEDISVLVSGRLPKDYQGDRTEDPNVVLGKILQEAKGFNTGLTIGFGPNIVVSRDDSGEDAALVAKRTIVPAPAIPGYRAPDVQVLTPALWEPVWLQTLMVNMARFKILVFMGRSATAKDAFSKLKEDVQRNGHLKQDRVAGTAKKNGVNGVNGVHVNGDSATAVRWPVDFLTLLPEKVGNVWFELGMDPIGKAYYDTEGNLAYSRYGVDVAHGALFVVRPDGWIGAKFDMKSSNVVNDIDAYLGGLLHR
jgi:phenol 2-monooxygenase (NADPH)